STKPVNVTGLSLSGADAANYSLTEPLLSADITSANRTLSGLSASSKIYDGTTSAALSGTPALVGIIGPDQVSLSGSAVATIVTRTAGSAKRVNVTGLNLSGADAANYSLTEPVLSANITPANLTITGVSANNKVYDDTIAATLSGTATLLGIIGADDVSLSGTAINTFVTRTAGSAKSVTVTGLSLTGADAANYTLNLPLLTANIAPAPLTVSGITANNKVYDATTAATIHLGAASLVGVFGSDNVSLDTTSALGTFDDANVGTAKNVLVSGLVLAGPDAGNYRLVQSTVTANVTPAGATVHG